MFFKGIKALLCFMMITRSEIVPVFSELPDSTGINGVRIEDDELGPFEHLVQISNS